MWNFVAWGILRSLSSSHWPELSLSLFLYLPIYLLLPFLLLLHHLDFSSLPWEESFTKFFAASLITWNREWSKKEREREMKKKASTFFSFFKTWFGHLMIMQVQGKIERENMNLRNIPETLQLPFLCLLNNSLLLLNLLHPSFYDCRLWIVFSNNRDRQAFCL